MSDAAKSPPNIGRLVSPLAVLLSALAVVAFLTASGVWNKDTNQQAWSRLGVQSMAHSFADLRNVLGAFDCARRGLDVYAANPCDPWHRPFNYPPVWLILGKTGIGGASADIVGASMAALFVIGLMVLFAPLRARWAWVAILATVSPMSLLLVERGNTDSLCWLLVLVAVTIGASLERRPTIGSGLVLAFASALKLYPLAAAAALAIRPRAPKWARYAGLVTGVVLVLVQITRLVQVVGNSDYGIDNSYGCWVAIFEIMNPGRLEVAVTVTATFAAIAAAWFLGRSQVRLPEISDPSFAASYLAGAAIYVGTFLLGANWGYRAVFLLFCLPLLCTQMDTTRGAERRFALAILFGILGFLWSLGTTMLNFVVSQALSWALFIVLLAQLFRYLRQSEEWRLLFARA